MDPVSRVSSESNTPGPNREPLYLEFVRIGRQLIEASNGADPPLGKSAAREISDLLDRLEKNNPLIAAQDPSAEPPGEPSSAEDKTSALGDPKAVDRGKAEITKQSALPGADTTESEKPAAPAVAEAKPAPSVSRPKGFETAKEFVEPIREIKMEWVDGLGYWRSADPFTRLDRNDEEMIRTFCKQLTVYSRGKLFPKDWGFQATADSHLRVVPLDLPWEDLTPLLRSEPSQVKAAEKGSSFDPSGTAKPIGTAEPHSEPVAKAGSEKSVPVAVQSPTSSDISTVSAVAVPKPTPVPIPSAIPVVDRPAPTSSEKTPPPAVAPPDYGLNLPTDRIFTSGPRERPWRFRFDGEKWITSDAPLDYFARESLRISNCHLYTMSANLNSGWGFHPEKDGNVSIKRGVVSLVENRPPLRSGKGVRPNQPNSTFVSGQDGVTAIGATPIKLPDNRDPIADKPRSGDARQDGEKQGKRNFRLLEIFRGGNDGDSKP